MILNWLVSACHLCCILLPVLNFEPFAIDKSLLPLAKPLPRPRPPLCDFFKLEFLDFDCLGLFRGRPLLGTALARQIPSPLLSLLPMPPLYALSHPLSLSPLPLPLLRNAWCVPGACLVTAHGLRTRIVHRRPTHADRPGRADLDPTAGGPAAGSSPESPAAVPSRDFRSAVSASVVRLQQGATNMAVAALAMWVGSPPSPSPP